MQPRKDHAVGADEATGTSKMTDHLPGAASVAVVGSLHYDILVTGAGRPRRGETLLGEAWAWKGGWKGGNQAVEAARHGSATAFVGAVGDDDRGEALLMHLARAQVVQFPDLVRSVWQDSSRIVSCTDCRISGTTWEAGAGLLPIPFPGRDPFQGDLPCRPFQAASGRAG